MALHKNFPKDPYAILDPEIRWFPADEDLRDTDKMQKLLPPLVSELRIKVKEWRDSQYDGASETSKALLNWWFKEEHILYDQYGVSSSFRYYFAQREALETVYSELFFADTWWPDFSQEEFTQIIGEFNTRERRRGK